MIYGRKIVTLCTSRLFDMENHRFVTQLNKALAKEKCSLWIYNINTDLYWVDEVTSAEPAVFDLIDYDKTDVIIWMDERIKSKRIAQAVISRAKAHEVPVITVDAEYEGCASVCFDYSAGFEKIVRHVIEEHHVERPHFMGGVPENPFSDARLAVFRRVLQEHGMPFDDSMVSYGLFWAKPTICETEKLIARGNLPDAIICANDIMAINVSNVLQQHGIAVPEDVIITGFDGIDEISFVNPNMTSVRCGGIELAAEVFRAVQACLADARHTAHYDVEPVLLCNPSCGCPNTVGIDKMYSFNDRFYRYQDDNQFLYEMIERMQACHSIAEASFCLFCEQIQDMSFVINKWCADNTVNHFESKKDVLFDDTCFLFFDTDIKPFAQQEIERTEIIPNLEQVIAHGFPLIFNVISFMGLPLGYLCFHFRDYELTNYCKIPQIVNTLSSGLGGFMNWQYQRHLMKQLEYIYKNDALTGLCNRAGFGKEFDRMKERLEGSGAALTVILADLDNLKQINDSFGHNAGDHAIRVTAAALKQACPEGALCVRFGGDEMLAVIPEACDAEAIMSAIQTYLREFNKTSGLEYSVSASVGARMTALNAQTGFEQIVKEADAAMYAEKQRRKQLMHT